MKPRPALWRSPKRIALIGNHLPRQCGIATFTADLLKALSQEAQDSECSAVVLNDRPGGYDYPDCVRFELNQETLAEYPSAAEFLNVNQVDVVCLQHEYGIFGGQDGAYILKCLEALRMPVVTTLHTVLQSPSPGQRNVLARIAQISDRLVVMSGKAEQLLQDVYGVPSHKIELIPHGIPDVPFVDPNYYKDQFGVEGRKVLLTFGLLSPGKGLEHMIEAMPRIVEAHPDVIYLVLGQTHPHIKRRHGESYRLQLQRRARELGIEEHIAFHNRFVDLDELCEFLGAADVYVTPYLNREQITSGTLAYALGTGKATVSTPYWHAEELLAEGRGRLVPFADPAALAEAIVDLLSHDTERHAMRKRAYQYCRPMVWKEVARRYLEVFEQVIRERNSQPRRVLRPRTLQTGPKEIPDLKMDHLLRLTDDVGILQHANGVVPNRHHGYCVDDNARALIAVLRAGVVGFDADQAFELACRYLSFLHHAFNEQTGRFRNFMSYERTWLEQVGSNDSHGRALWALGVTLELSQQPLLRSLALRLFDRALPAVLEMDSPRAWAYSLLGIHGYLQSYSGDSEVRRIRQVLAERLDELFEKRGTSQWPWCEDRLTYANAKLPHALMVSGHATGRSAMVERGLRALDWLITLQTDVQGHLVPIGSNGWYLRGGSRARFAQQPIEAMNLIEACCDAARITMDEQWITRAHMGLDWFLGRNDLKVPLYDYQTGGCCDGLEATGANENQGAESTLMWLMALTRMIQYRQDQVSQTQATTPDIVELPAASRGQGSRAVEKTTRSAVDL